MERRSPSPTLALALFCGLLALLMLAYGGRTVTIDEQSVMVTADSLARFGTVDSDLLAFSHWDLPPPSGLGRLGVNGEYYSKKAPGMALLAAPFVWLAQRLPWLGNQSAALLLPVLLTSLSGVFLYRLGLRLKFSPVVAVAAAVLMVVASLATIYSRLLFTESLALAGLMLALLGAQAGRETTTRFTLSGLGLALAVGANLVYLAIVPLFIVFVAVTGGARTRLRRSLALLWPVVVAIALVAVLNVARFGDILGSGYHFDAGEGFTTPLWLGTYGLLASPARGLLWYVPLSWLAIPGWFMFRRRHAPLAWLSVAVVIWHVGVFGAWWSWAGGVSWGPRFLLPIMPVLALCLLPIVEAAFIHKRRIWQVMLGIFAALSIAVQIVGIGADMNQIEVELSAASPWTPESPPGFNHGWETLNLPALSPIVIGARLLSASAPSLAWFQTGAPDWIALALLASVLIGAVWWIARLLRQWPSGMGGRHAAMLIGWTIVVVNLSLARLVVAPTGLSGQPLTELPPALASALPGDVVLSLTPDLTWAMLEFADRPPVVGLPRAAGSDDADAVALFEGALGRARRVWLLTYDPPPADWYAATLESRGDLAHEALLDGYHVRIYKLP